MMRELVLDYEQAYVAGKSIVGGKAYSICKLKKNNIKVPNGIVLPYKLCNELLTCNEDEYKDFLQIILKRVSANRFAVRSSAIGEDAKDFSWAGCFESYLCVREEDLLDKIILCIKSLNNARVKAYANLHGTKPLKKIAVIVQEYIYADYNGICFTANPIAENKDQMIIEYQKGGSGSVVGGSGIPTTLIIEKDMKLPAFLEELVHVSKIIENHWGYPLDIEWVIKNGELTIIQSRPLTTL